MPDVCVLPPSEWSHLHPALLTDAPFRETASAIADAERAGVHAVEMEASALYALPAARRVRVVCVARVTNTMAVDGNDFEKGEADGTHRILQVTAAIARRLGHG